jgi:PAS domain S-box-containing protein
VGIAVAGLDGRFQSMNRRFLEIIGYPRDEATGLSFLEITHPDDLEATRGHVKRLLAARSSTTFRRSVTCAGTAASSGA